MTTARRTAWFFALLAVVAGASVTVPVSPALAQDCGNRGSTSTYICMALILGQIAYGIESAAEEKRAEHERAIQDIRDRYGADQMTAAREIARYRRIHNIDVSNRPIVGSTPPQSLTADTVRASVGTSATGATNNDPVEMCWGGSMIKRSECPPRPGP